MTGIRALLKRLWETSTIRIAAVVLLITAAIVVSAILQGDVPDIVVGGTHWIRQILHKYTYLASYGLLYIEESGIPLPAPGASGRAVASGLGGCDGQIGCGVSEAAKHG